MTDSSQERAVPSYVAAKLRDLKQTRDNSKKPYWKLLEPVVQWEGDVANVKLQCHMGCYLTSSNVSQTAERHFHVVDGKLGCKKRVASEAPGAPTAMS